MKKHPFILSFVLLSSLLFSCSGSKSLSQAEGIARLQKIQAFHDASDFAYNDAKVNFAMQEEVTIDGKEDTKSHYILHYEKEHYYYLDYFDDYNVNHSTSTHTSTTGLTYLYEQDGKYYQAESNASGKTYQELSSGDFLSALQSKIAEGQKLVETMAEASYYQLERALTLLNASSHPVSLTSIQVVKNFSFASSGADSLDLSYEQEIQRANSAYSNSTMLERYEGSYPVYSTTNTSGKIFRSSLLLDDTDKGSMTIEWGQCTALYPNLSEYTQK
jgi:hypothetical protein